jgi:ribonuclease HepT-like protein
MNATHPGAHGAGQGREAPTIGGVPGARISASHTRGLSNVSSRSSARRCALLCNTNRSSPAKITDPRAIIAFRNQLTHAYGAVDHPTVWGLLERPVPQLRAEVTRLLEGLAGE